MTGAQQSAVLPVDPYPSRCSDKPAILPRLEPVCHGGVDAVGPCSRAELETFERDGCLLARGLFAPDEIAALLRDEQRAADDMRDADERLVREPDNDRVVRSLFAFHALGGILGRLASDERLVARAEQILHSPVVVHQSRINRKPAFDGREFWWHSDFETWHVEDGMPAMRALSACVFLTDSLSCNGALLLLPGSHRHFIACLGRTPEAHYRHSLRRQEYGVPDRESISRIAETSGYVVAEGRPGDVMFFDCNTLHGSPGNLSHRPRTGAFLVYNSIHNRCGDPTSGQPPRPEHICARAQVEPIVATSGPLTESSQCA